MPERFEHQKLYRSNRSFGFNRVFFLCSGYWLYSFHVLVLLTPLCLGEEGVWGRRGLGEEGGGVWGRQGRGLGEAGERTGGEKKTAKFLSAASTFFGGLRAVFSEWSEYQWQMNHSLSQNKPADHPLTKSQRQPIIKTSVTAIINRK